MFKSVLAAGALAVLLASPAFADDMMMKCDEATMMKMQSDLDSMKDMKADKMKMAKDEMMMAKEAMDKKDDKACMDHMKKAADEMKM